MSSVMPLQTPSDVGKRWDCTNFARPAASREQPWSHCSPDWGTRRQPMSWCGSGSDSIGTVSNTDPAPEAINLTQGVVPAVDVVEARKAAIGDGAEVRRLLPQRTLRTIGAWCFLDHYGPDEVSRGPGMQVPPHPHIGLQTVSCLFQGLVLHRDSLGSRQLIRPGDLSLMTAGLSEISLSPAGGRVLARFFVIGGVPFGEPLL